MNSLLNTFKNNKDLISVIFENKKYSYKDLLDKILDLQVKFSEYNIKKGSRVVILSDFSFIATASFFALANLKAIIIPISSQNEVEVESKIAISEADFKIQFINQTVEFNKLNNFKEKHSLYIELDNSNRAGLVLFSSGTTGVPKAMLMDLDSFFIWLRPNVRTYTSIVFLMFDHIGGLNTLLQILISGGTIVIPNNRDSSHVLELIEKYSVELLPTSPTFLNLILISEAYKNYDLSSLRYITYGTEPMPQMLLNRLNVIFPNANFKQTYGLSELGIMKTQSKSPGSLFMKLGGDGFEFKIIESQLYIKSNTSMLGYLNAENPFDEDGFFATGDTVEQDEDGYLKIIGRIKDFINVGGQKVTPSEVESVILNISEVLDVTVRGEKNSLMGEVVVAYILAKDNSDINILKETILKECSASLDNYKVPVRLKFIEKIHFTERFKKTRLGEL